MNPAAEYYEQYLNSNTEHTEHTFEEAITALKAGKAIKRKDDATIIEDIPNNSSLSTMNVGSNLPPSSNLDIKFSRADIVADDWIIIDKPYVF